MSQSRNTKVRRLGAVRASLKTPQKDVIPRLGQLQTTSGGDMSGITGNAMTVPPQKEKSAAREVVQEKPKSAVKSDSGNSGKSDSASSTKSQESQDKKELQEQKEKLIKMPKTRKLSLRDKAREKDLLKQLSSLQKLIDDLKEQIKQREGDISELQDKLVIQEDNLTSLLEQEQQHHKTTQDARVKVQKELDNCRQELQNLRKECQENVKKLKQEYEDQIATLTQEKDKEIKIRDEKLNRLKMQMADALKGNSWERQQQLEELTKELGRLQEEADSLRLKLKSFRSKGQSSSCANCQDSNVKVEKLQLAMKEKDVTIKDLKAMIVKFEKQLTQQDEILKMWAEGKGQKFNSYK